MRLGFDDQHNIFCQQQGLDRKYHFLFLQIIPIAESLRQFSTQKHEWIAGCYSRNRRRVNSNSKSHQLVLNIPLIDDRNQAFVSSRGISGLFPYKSLHPQGLRSAMQDLSEHLLAPRNFEKCVAFENKLGSGWAITWMASRRYFFE